LTDLPEHPSRKTMYHKIASMIHPFISNIVMLLVFQRSYSYLVSPSNAGHTAHLLTAHTSKTGASSGLTGKTLKLSGYGLTNRTGKNPVLLICANRYGQAIQYH
jgi:hypothetical protein